jgi:hypothetical protein
MECRNIKDQIFKRQLEEVMFMMLVLNGDREAALVKGYEIRAHAKKYSQVD